MPACAGVCRPMPVSPAPLARFAHLSLPSPSLTAIKRRNPDTSPGDYPVTVTCQLTAAMTERLSRYLSSPARPEGTLSYLALRGFLFAVVCAPRTDLSEPPENRILGLDGEEELFCMEDAAREAFLDRIQVIENNLASLGPEGSSCLHCLLGGKATPGRLREWSSGFIVGLEWVWDSWFQVLSGRRDASQEVLFTSWMTFSYLADPVLYHRTWETPEPGRDFWDSNAELLFSRGAGAYAAFSDTLAYLVLGEAGSAADAERSRPPREREEVQEGLPRLSGSPRAGD